jgi:soluble lytic murein transglycosylase-like protein
LANLRAGTRHLSKLLDQFDGDLTLALAAYNAGAGAVKQHNGVPAYAETVDYVRKVHEKLGKRPRGLPAKRAVREERPIRFSVLSDGSVLISN